MESLPVNGLDAFIILIVGVSAIAGLMRGFVKEVLSVAAWVGAAWISLTFYDEAKEVVAGQLTDPLAISVVAGGGLFLVALVVLMIIARILSSGAKATTMLGPVDRTLGVVFGVVRGALFLGLAYLLTLELVDDSALTPKWVDESKLLPYVESSARFLEALIPQRVGEAQELIQNPQDRLEGTGYTPEINRQIQDLIERQTPE